MNNYYKKPLLPEQIEPLCQKYNIDKILASIFVRRDITEGKDILYFLEDDLRFMHDPFLLPNMDDAVERILQAKDEGEKVLIFGDSDVDGITSTAILYNQLRSMGIDVSWKVPMADDSYGLSISAVDEFAAEQGTLIITVDCGISNFVEIEHANSLGIDVIITDHHNPQDTLPEAILIIDPKLPESKYPYKDISGAAVAFKLVSALRYSETDFYDSEVSIINLTEEKDNTITINCLKIKNNVKIKQLTEKIIPGKTSIYDLRFPTFLQSTIIYAWDINQTKTLFSQIFGNGIEFNLYDLRALVAQEIPAIKNKAAKDLPAMSTIAKYIDEEKSIINSIYNVYITFCKKRNMKQHPQMFVEERKDLQLVALSSLADIMPMKDENRIFVKNGILSMQKDGPRSGLGELFVELNLSTPNYSNLNSIEISWKVNPVLNSTGRLGSPDVAVKLLLSEDPKERVLLAKQIIELNNERKQIVQDTAFKVRDKALESVAQHNNKLCVVVDDSIRQGLTGLFANRLMSDHDVPAIAITFSDNVCIGSMRSYGNLISTDFLNSFGDFFINHGGHNYAAGFSFERHKLPEFLNGIKQRLPSIPEKGEPSQINIDAEIPVNYINPDIFKLLDTFEPYGNENNELTLLTKSASICDSELKGQKEPYSLKINFDFGNVKVPAMLWNQGDRYNKDIKINNNYDIIYKLSRNYFRGNITNQFEIIKI